MPRWRPLMALALCACSDDDAPSGIVSATSLRVAVTNLATLASAAGRYELWVVDRAGTRRSLGAVAGFETPAVVQQTVSDAVAIEVTWERPGDTDPGPSAYRLLRGELRGGSVELTPVGAVTRDGIELHRAPGQFTMFSPSDNFRAGYPSFEEAGVWLFNMAPRQLPQNDMWVRLAQLQPGWVYEGWMVRDIDQPGATWLSYGKFLPDATGTINSRDDTGWGAFSGVTDFRTAGEEEFPGDDWISNPLGFPLPGGLTLPLNLREKNASGVVRWTHVITIEPASDRGEPITTERPFVIRPYRDPFGDGGPGIARSITYRSDGVPGGRVTVP
jgi:hypothetical protein